MAACDVSFLFEPLALTVHVDPFLHYMGMCVFFALAVVPVRAVFATVEIYRDWRLDHRVADGR